MEQRIAVVETEVKTLKESVHEVHQKLDDISSSLVRVDTHLSNGIGKRIADEIERNRAGKARTQQLILAAIGTVVVVLQLVAIL